MQRLKIENDGVDRREFMKTKLFIFAVSLIAFFYFGSRYGETHRTFKENWEYIWENGQGFSHGWSACEDAYGIKWVRTNGWYGWVCTRVAGNVPPGWTESVIATNHYEP